MQWFKHDTSANMDAKLQQVLLDYGLEGYGLYWYCIELIAGKISIDNVTFALEHDARIIARNTGSTPQKVEEMMKRFIELELFESSNGDITCMKLARRLDQSMTGNAAMRTLISKVKNENHDSVMTQSCKNRIDKIRIDKNRESSENPKSTKKFIKPTVKQICEHMTSRGFSFASSESERFFDYYESNGWKVGKNPMKSWKSAINNWLKNSNQYSGQSQQMSPGYGSSPRALTHD